jgi:hypothetical protein
MRTAGTVEAEWRQLLRGSVSTGAKEDESSTGRVLKLMNRLFLECCNVVGGGVAAVNRGS